MSLSTLAFGHSLSKDIIHQDSMLGIVYVATINLLIQILCQAVCNSWSVFLDAFVRMGLSTTGCLIASFGSPLSSFLFPHFSVVLNP
jgi:hypothetical protein